MSLKECKCKKNIYVQQLKEGIKLEFVSLQYFSVQIVLLNLRNIGNCTVDRPSNSVAPQHNHIATGAVEALLAAPVYANNLTKLTKYNQNNTVIKPCIYA
jgi:hypothetical protein